MLWQPDALETALRLPHTLILPVVAYAERARQYIQQGRTARDLSISLAMYDITVEGMGYREALRCAAEVTDDAVWQKLARDAMIAGHVGPEDVLWTANPRDFIDLGVPEEAIIDTTTLPSPTRLTS